MNRFYPSWRTRRLGRSTLIEASVTRGTEAFSIWTMLPDADLKACTRPAIKIADEIRLITEQLRAVEEIEA